MCLCHRDHFYIHQPGETLVRQFKGCLKSRMGQQFLQQGECSSLRTAPKRGCPLPTPRPTRGCLCLLEGSPCAGEGARGRDDARGGDAPGGVCLPVQHGFLARGKTEPPSGFCLGHRAAETPAPVLSKCRFSAHLKCFACVIPFDWPAFMLSLERHLGSSKAGNEL